MEAKPMDCDQHAHPNSSLGDSAAPSCSRQECDFCPAITKLRAEISKAQDIVAKLLNQHNALISQINDHHKPLINRLPFELISQIFIDIFSECSSSYWGVLVPLRLGGVCRMWRNVTLGTPQLWTFVRIRIKSCGPSYDLNVAKEWFRRSRTLPLSIDIKFVDCRVCKPFGRDDAKFDSSIAFMRSYSSRWSRVDISSNSAHLLHELLDDLQNPPEDLEHLSVGWCHATSQKFDTNPVLLPRSITQTDTREGGIGLLDLPCGFERLTHMELCHVPVDEVIYFFQNAPNLRECSISLNEDVDLDDVTYPLPTTPIVAQHLSSIQTDFSANAEFFCHLTLPSLQTLKHQYYTISSQEDLEELFDCLDRSSPPLRDFNLEISISPFPNDDWYEMLPPTVTSITVNISEHFFSSANQPHQWTTTEDFLAALAIPSGTSLLPRLERLCLITRGMSEVSWTLLCDLFHDYRDSDSPNATPEHIVGENSTTPRRLLKKIEIHQTEKEWERDFEIETQVFEFFEGLKKKVGVELKVDSFYGPEFGRTCVIVNP